MIFIILLSEFVKSLLATSRTRFVSKGYTRSAVFYSMIIMALSMTVIGGTLSSLDEYGFSLLIALMIVNGLGTWIGIKYTHKLDLKRK